MLDIDFQSEDINEIMIEDLCRMMKDEIFLETPINTGRYSSMISSTLPIHSFNENKITVKCIEFNYMMSCSINVSNIPFESEDFGLFIDTDHCFTNMTHNFYKIFAEYCFKMAYIQVKINDPPEDNYLGAGAEFTRNKDHIYQQIQKLFLKKHFITNTWYHFLREFDKLIYAIQNNVQNQVIWTPSNQEQNLFRIPTQYFPQMTQMPYRNISNLEYEIHNMNTSQMETVANLLTKSLPIHSQSEAEPYITIDDDSDYVTHVILIVDSPDIRVNNRQRVLKISYATIPPEELVEDQQLLKHYFEFLFQFAFYDYLTTYFVYNNYVNSYSILLNEDDRWIMLRKLMDVPFVINAGRMFVLYLYHLIKWGPDNFHWEFQLIPSIPQYNNLIETFENNTTQVISYEYILRFYCDSIFDS